MAARKKTIKARIDAVTRALLEPGEQVEVSALGIKGPSPYLWALLQAFPVGSGVADDLFRSCFVVLTDRRLLIIKTKVSWRRTQGGGLAFAEPRSRVSVVRFKRRFPYTVLTLRRADESTLRLNFSWRPWREEATALYNALSEGSARTPATA
jgi:hypothetical protein